MKPQVKIGLYVATALGTLIFGILFLNAWRRVDAAGDSQVATTQAGETNVAELTPEEEQVPATGNAVLARPGLGSTILWALLAFGSLAGLGGLAAYDLTQYAANRAAESLFDEEGDDVSESLYEQVEKVHAQGDYLEAVRLLREYLQEHPRAVHAQVRIAEIYEKDLNNPVAAVLEYEDLLKQSYEPERKGWNAVHLVNLYNRLGKRDEAVALLQRIVVEFAHTPAADKARERLVAIGAEVPEPEPPAGAESNPAPPSNLPPGFRPKV